MAYGIKELKIGNVGMFKHCDMGIVKAKVDKANKIGSKTYYTCTLIEVTGSEARHPSTAFSAKVMMHEGKSVAVFIQAHELIKYVEDEPQVVH